MGRKPFDAQPRQRRRQQDNAKPIATSQGCNGRGEVWCELEREFGQLFAVLAGKPQTIDARRSRDGQHRHRARVRARELFAA